MKQKLTDNNYTLLSLFQESLKREPDKNAVVQNEDKLTYRELDDISNFFANLLIDRGIEQEDLVVVLMDRSIISVISILSIIKAGGAYIPLNSGYQDKRLESILNLAKPKFVLTTTSNMARLDKQFHTLALDSFNLREISDVKLKQKPKLKRRSLAYIIFTSGSTGEPKGVMIEQESIVNLVTKQNYLKFSDKLEFLHLSNISFDAATFEIWGALLNGGTLVIVNDEDALSIDNYRRLGRTYTNLCCFITTSLFEALVGEAQDIFKGYYTVIFGGEASHVSIIQRYINLAKDNLPRHLVNAYGPTECTTFAACYKVPLKLNFDNMPIGYPVENILCFIMKDDEVITQPNVEGELYLSGKGLARSYLNNPLLTKEKFTSYSALKNMRLYSTGDHVKYGENQEIIYLGRHDNQIKLRGYRIELDEIENSLIKLREIDNAVVAMQRRANIDQNKIVAYLKMDAKRIRREGVGSCLVLAQDNAEQKPYQYVNLSEHGICISARNDEFHINDVIEISIDNLGNAGPKKATVKWANQNHVGVMFDSPIDLNNSISQVNELKLNQVYKSRSGIFAYLGKILPSYMLPAKFYIVDDFEYNLNYKIDRQSLDKIDKLEAKFSHEGPMSNTEKLVQKIWQDILGLDAIGLHEEFLTLGGNSISAIKISHILNRKYNNCLNHTEMYQLNTIRKLAEHVSKQSLQTTKRIKHSNSTQVSLTLEQNRLLYIDKYKPGTSTNTLVFSVNIEGTFDTDRFQSALLSLFADYPIFGCYFEEDVRTNNIIQVKTADGQPRVELIDLSQHNDSKKEAELFICKNLVNTNINTSSPSLFNFYIVKLDSTDFKLIWTVHHTLFDAWSVNLLISQLFEYYFSKKDIAPNNTESKKLSYFDYAIWQTKGDDFKNKLDINTNFWHQALIGAPPTTTIKADAIRKDIQLFQAGHLEYVFDDKLSCGIHRFCKDYQVTPFCYFNAIIAILLSAYSGQRDLVVGVPLTTRENEQLAKMIGCFVHVIPNRISFSPKSSMVQFAQEIQASLNEGVQHNVYSLSQLLEKLNIEQEQDIAPLFQVLINYNELSFDEIEQESIRVYEPVEHSTNNIFYDLIFDFFQRDNMFSVKIHYASSLHYQETIQRVLDNLTQLLNAPINKPDQNLEYYLKLSNISGEEKGVGVISKADTKTTHLNASRKNNSVVQPKAILESIIKIWQDVLEKTSIDSEVSLFSLGGNSLNYLRIIARINKEISTHLSLKDIYRLKTPYAIAEYIQSISPSEPHSTSSLISSDLNHSLTPAQTQIWYIEKLYPYNSAYHIPVIFEISKKPDLRNLNKAINFIIQNHDVFQIAFSPIEKDTPTKMIVQPDEFNAQDLFLDNNDKAALFYTMIMHPFNLSHAPLFRCAYCDFSSGEKYLIFVFHHIIMDGWSVHLFFKQLNNLYNHYGSSEEKELDITEFSNEVNFNHYSRGFEIEIPENQLSEQRQFWNQYLKEAPVRSPLPLDYERANKRTFHGGRVYFSFPLSMTQKINDLAMKHHSTKYSFLLASFNMLLYKLSGHQQNTIAIPVNDRRKLSYENVIGYLVDVKPFYEKISTKLTFLDLLTKTQFNLTELLSHNNLSFNDILKEINYPSTLEHEPLCQVLFVLQEIEKYSLSLSNVQSKEFTYDYPISKYDLSVSLEVHEQQLTGYIEYATGLFKKKTICKWIDYWQICIESILQNPNKPIDQVSLFQHKDVIYKSTEAVLQLESNNSLYLLWQHAVRLYPSRPCLLFEGKTTNYSEFDRLVDKVASSLTQKGIQPNDRVILYFKRSTEFIISILALIKCGACFIPAEYTTPRERLSNIVDLTDPKLIIYNTSTPPMRDARCISISSLMTKAVKHTSGPAKAVDLNHDAYIIFTSGTTGTPKGVPIQYKSIFARVKWWLETFTLNSDDVFYNPFAIHFDGFLGSLFWPLFSGTCLVLPNEEQSLNMELGIDLIINHKVNHMVATPSYYDYVLDNNKVLNSKLKNIYFAGESLSPSILKKAYLIEGVNTYNFYGPTECTIIASYTKLTNTEDKIHVGQPVAGVQIHVLDSQLRLLPVGVYGDIYLSGVGLASKYLGQIEANTNFLDNPNSQGQKMYRTGDVGRWQIDGGLELLGRKDNQIKLRGFRIELDEIYNALLEQPAIEKAYVNFDENEIKAYVVSNMAEPDLRNALKKTIPYYMMPSKIYHVPYIPLKQSGKVDEETVKDLVLTTAKEEKYTPSVQAMLKVFENVLNIPNVPPSSSFFKLGGHSLLVAKLLTQVRSSFNKDIQLEDIYAYPSAKDLAEYIESKDRPQFVFDFNINAPYMKDTLLVQNLNLECSTNQGRSVLVTGANGFLGFHVIEYLLNHTHFKIYALTQQPDKLSIRFPNELYTRLLPIQANIAKRYFGLNKHIYTLLQNEIGYVFHCASVVNHILPYDNLRDVNVLSNVEILKLASKGCKKRVIYLSTLSACFDTNNQAEIIEDIGSTPPSLQQGGYLTSKWVSEQLYKVAKQRGFDVTILRPTLILENSQTRYFNSKDNHVFILARAICQLGMVPNNLFIMDGLPVDFVAKILVELATSSKMEHLVYNLNHPQPITSNTLFDWIEEQGIKLSYTSIQQWQEQYLSKLNAKDDAYRLIPLYLKRDDITNINQQKPIHKQAVNTHVAELISYLGLSYPKLSKTQLDNFIQLLINSL
tara:strand:- start:7341 stop:15338 length:7998 start_codon:yes stop_codon:yes gene_type:complete